MFISKKSYGSLTLSHFQQIKVNLNKGGLQALNNTFFTLKRYNGYNGLFVRQIHGFDLVG